jgi:hypothetical protein
MIRIVLVACMMALVRTPSIAAAAANCGNTGLAYFRGNFTVHVLEPPKAAFALFDPAGERRWDPTWTPRFLHGDAHAAGSVFQTSHGGHILTWLMDSYDAATNSVSYIVVAGDRSIMKIGIELLPESSGSRANVAYERTALNAAGRQDVSRFCTTFPGRQNEWQNAIDGATK